MPRLRPKFLSCSLLQFPDGRLMDGSTDAGNGEDELVVIFYCYKDDTAQEVRSCARYVSLEIPTKADTEGLIKCLGDALKTLGVDKILDKADILGVEGKPVLVSGGMDGASVNIAEHNGMNGRMRKELPWLLCTWCYTQ